MSLFFLNFFLSRSIQIWADSCWKTDTDWTRSQTTRTWTSFLPKPWVPPSAAAPLMARPAACSELYRSAFPLDSTRAAGSETPAFEKETVGEASARPCRGATRRSPAPCSCGDVTNLIRILFSRQTPRDVLNFAAFFFLIVVVMQFYRKVTACERRNSIEAHVRLSMISVYRISSVTKFQSLSVLPYRDKTTKTTFHTIRALS